MYELLQQLKLENKIVEYSKQVQILDLLDEKEVKNLKGELEKIAKEVTCLPKSESEKLLREIKNLREKAEVELLRREEWKIKYFWPVVGLTGVSSFAAGYGLSKKFNKYDLEKFCAYLESELKENGAQENS